MNTILTGKAKPEVRISAVLSKGELTATASRRQAVKNGLDKLGIPCDVDKVPNIAVLGSGGGLRAMIALYGTLVELKKCNLLDCVMYLCGVSGSTWCMSNIYRNEDWTEKIELLEKEQREKLVQGKWNIVKAKKAVVEAARDEDYSLTDFWAYFIVYKMLKEIDESTLSNHKKSCETGKNPYPVYAAVDKYTYSGHHAGSWTEFTPHEVGTPGVGGTPERGGYVDMKYLGSVFKNGQLLEEKKEKIICYLQGLWGSALASEKEIKKTIIESLLELLNMDKEESSILPLQDLKSFNLLTKLYEYVLELQLCVSDVSASSAMRFIDLLENILKIHRSSKSYEAVREMRQIWPTANAETREKACLKLWEAFDNDFGGLSQAVPLNPFQKTRDLIRHIHKTNYCLLTWTWGCTRNFLLDCGEVKVPELKRKEVVSLIDAGLAINTAYPLILQPDRNVKLILSFDFSSGDPFETVKKAAEYCKIHGIKFPKLDETQLKDVDNPSDCYIFRGDGLTVMHFPLFNKVNCQDKIAECADTFKTFKLSYTDEEIGKLLSLAKQNVTNVQQKIVEEIKHIVGSSTSQRL